MERMFSREGIGSVVDHVLRLMAHREHPVRALLDGDDGGLVDDDALARDGDQCIGSPEVDGHVRRHLAGQPGERV